MIPPPQVPAPSETGRRVYFERLAATLLAQGVPGDRIGELVAELDGHVAMAGVDPVDELGPVGELATALATSISDRRPWRSFLGDSLFGSAAGVAVAAGGALLFGRQPGSGVVLHLGIAAYMAVLTTGISLLRGYGSRSLVGKSRFEIPSRKVFVPFLIVVAVVSAATQNWQWTISVGAALAVFAVSLVTSALLATWSIRRSRINIPGRVRHLRRLQWGPFGR